MMVCNEVVERPVLAEPAGRPACMSAHRTCLSSKLPSVDVKSYVASLTFANVGMPNIMIYPPWQKQAY